MRGSQLLRIAETRWSAAPGRFPPRRSGLERLASLDLERIVPRLLVGLPVLFNLWVLRSETTVVNNLNDSHLHLAMVRWARGQILEGKLPLDGWFPILGLGSAHFRHYSVLPHILTAYLSLIAGAPTTYFWLIYLLIALWPVCVYLGARLLDWDRWTALGAALVAPLLVSASGYGYEQLSYTWYGYGLWAQLWGMWMFPLSLGLTWRAVRGKGSLLLGALALSATIACHFITGYLALLATGLWGVVTPSRIMARLARAVIVGVSALLAASWALVPVLQDRHWMPGSEFFRGNTFDVGFGAPTVLGWLFRGQIYDFGRLPVVSTLVAVGLLVCLVRFRRDERGRAVVALWVVSLLLFFGRPTLGFLLDFLPGSSYVLQRAIIGVHMSGVLLAGIGAAWLGRSMLALSRRYLPNRRFLPRLRTALATVVIMVLGVAAFYPGWSQVAAGDELSAMARSNQQLWESTDGADLQVLVDDVKTLGGGRVYAGARWSWGQSYTVGYAPVYAVLGNQDVDSIGFKLRVSSLMANAEMLFDERNPAQYDMFNVRYLILPNGQQPPVRATLLARQGRHTLWEVATSGYFEVVDTTGPPLVEDGSNIAARSADFLQSQQLASLRYPTVAFDGAKAAAPTLIPGAVVEGPAGTVEQQASSLDDGTFNAEIIANRAAVVLLKASYDPRWKVTLDGSEVRPEVIAPAMVGATVPAGRHSITFQYIPDSEYPLLFIGGLLVLLGLGLGPKLVSGGLFHRIRAGLPRLRWRSDG